MSTVWKQNWAFPFSIGGPGHQADGRGEASEKTAEPLCREYQLLLEEIEAGRQAGKPLRLGITSGILFAAQDGLTSLEQQNITLIDTYDDLCRRNGAGGRVSMGIVWSRWTIPALRSPLWPGIPCI